MLADGALQIRVTVVQPAKRTDLEGRGDRSLKCSPGCGVPTPPHSRGPGEKERLPPRAAAHTATLATRSGYIPRVWWGWEKPWEQRKASEQSRPQGPEGAISPAPRKLPSQVDDHIPGCRKEGQGLLGP